MFVSIVRKRIPSSHFWNADKKTRKWTHCMAVHYIIPCKIELELMCMLRQKFRLLLECNEPFETSRRHLCCSATSAHVQPWMCRAGFQKIRNDSYFIIARLKQLVSSQLTLSPSSLVYSLLLLFSVWSGCTDSRLRNCHTVQGARTFSILSPKDTFIYL